MSEYVWGIFDFLWVYTLTPTDYASELVQLSLQFSMHFQLTLPSRESDIPLPALYTTPCAGGFLHYDNPRLRRHSLILMRRGSVATMILLALISFKPQTLVRSILIKSHKSANGVGVTPSPQLKLIWHSARG